jgi:septal ring factor EnvC (AmiA/AmiB activator)
MKPRLLQAWWREWNPLRAVPLRVWLAGALLVVVSSVLTELVSAHLKERQLVKREQSLRQMYDDVQSVVRNTEEVAQRIEQDLKAQQRMMTSLESALQQSNDPRQHLQTAIELPLEQAPSP